jgi:hypothetical protein
LGDLVVDMRPESGLLLVNIKNDAKLLLKISLLQKLAEK